MTPPPPFGSATATTLVEVPTPNPPKKRQKRIYIFNFIFYLCPQTNVYGCNKTKGGLIAGNAENARSLPIFIETDVSISAQNIKTDVSTAVTGISGG